MVAADFFFFKNRLQTFLACETISARILELIDVDRMLATFADEIAAACAFAKWKSRLFRPFASTIAAHHVASAEQSVTPGSLQTS